MTTTNDSERLTEARTVERVERYQVRPSRVEDPRVAVPERTREMKIAWLYNPVSFGAHRAALNWEDLEAGESGLTGSDLVVVSYARELAYREHPDLGSHHRDATGPS